MSWLNTDGLYVKFGTEEAARARGGDFHTQDSTNYVEVILDYTDIQSTTNTLVGAVAVPSTTPTGSVGIELPKGARIEAVETIAITAFTSSGIIGTSTLVMGLIKEDRTTELDYDGFTTISFVGSSFDVTGERVYIGPGVTGAGALIGTTLSEKGYLCVANSQHALHPFTAGKLKVRIYFNYSVTN